MKSKIFLFTLFALIIALSGCALLESRLQAKNCEYRIISNRIAGKLQGSNLVVTVPVEARNPHNQQNAIIDRMRLTLYVGDKKSLQGEVPSRVTIPSGNAPQEFTANFTITGQGLLTVLNAIRNKNVSYKITGTLFVNITIPGGTKKEKSFEITIMENAWK